MVAIQNRSERFYLEIRYALGASEFIAGPMFILKTIISRPADSEETVFARMGTCRVRELF